MSAAALLVELNRQGFSLTPDGDSIRVTPASRLTAEQRATIRAHKPALMALLAAPRKPASAFLWDQAEAERLLAQLREALARVDADVAAGKAPAARADALRTWLEVAEGYVKDRDLEATRGWDALELLRGAVARAVGLATPPTRNPCL